MHSFSIPSYVSSCTSPLQWLIHTKYSKIFYDQPHKTQAHVITVSLISPHINETIRLYATVYYGNLKKAFYITKIECCVQTDCFIDISVLTQQGRHTLKLISPTLLILFLTSDLVQCPGFILHLFLFIS
jgi:hypothetical protein